MATGKPLPAKKTTATTEEAIRAVSDAFEVVFGERPPLGALLVLAAQSALETGRWKAMKNYNVAGLKASKSGPYDYAVYSTREVFNGKRVTLDQPFRAYATLAGGMIDWLVLIARKYAAALAKAMRYDPTGFAVELKKAGYYTADAAEYAAGVRSLAAEFALLDLPWGDLCEAASYGSELMNRVMAATEAGDG